MADKGWKAAERRFAGDVGSARKPCDGSRAGADFEDSLCCYQLKIRRMIPGWLWTWLGGVQATARTSGRIGVLVLKHPRQRDTEALVVLAWQDWIDLHGNSATRGASPHGKEERRSAQGHTEAHGKDPSKDNAQDLRLAPGQRHYTEAEIEAFCRSVTKTQRLETPRRRASRNGGSRD